MNKELIWLAEQVGIHDIRRYGSNGQLAGGIFMAIEKIKQKGCDNLCSQCHAQEISDERSKLCLDCFAQDGP